MNRKERRAGFGHGWGPEDFPDVGTIRQTTLPDGSIGWYMRRRDDCFAAAVATCLEIDYMLVPDEQRDQQRAWGVTEQDIERNGWRLRDNFFRERGLWMRVVPGRVKQGRCVGIVSRSDRVHHCVVLQGGAILHDPVSLGGVRSPWSIKNVRGSIIFWPVEGGDGDGCDQ